MQAQIIRFPIERCRRRSSGGIETLMLVPMAFYLTMTGMFLSHATVGERSEPVVVIFQTCSKCYNRRSCC